MSNYVTSSGRINKSILHVEGSVPRVQLRAAALQSDSPIFQLYGVPVPFTAQSSFLPDPGWPWTHLYTFLLCVVLNLFPGPFLVQSTWDTVYRFQRGHPQPNTPLFSALTTVISLGLLSFYFMIFLYKCIFDGIPVNDVSVLIICTTVIGLFCKKQENEK